jgi:hypothetical protein
MVIFSLIIVLVLLVFSITFTSKTSRHYAIHSPIRQQVTKEQKR